MSGHGHVIPNADGSKARCGGPQMCSVCALEYAQAHGGAMQIPVAAEPKSEIQRLRDEVAFLKSCRAVELAIRNPSVADYMRHWEARAESAEAKLVKAKTAFEQIAGMDPIEAALDPEWAIDRARAAIVET